MNPKLHFSHPYNKLLSDEYTTIRRKNSFNQYAIGDIFDITIDQKNDHQAKLIKKEIKSIHELPLDFLKNDCEYDDFSIECTLEYFLDRR
jgi:hypothetical protein